MKRISFDYTVKAVVSFTGAELGRFMAISNLHYDGACRAAGSVGGFLYGFCIQWLSHNQDKLAEFDSISSFQKMSGGLLELTVEVVVVPRELGLLAKIAELESLYCSRPVTVGIQSMRLSERVTAIFNECSVEYDRIGQSFAFDFLSRDYPI